MATPILVVATYNGHPDIARLLLARGASADGRDAKGSTALMGVAFKGERAIARLLIAAGADPNGTNAAGQTALMMAAMFGRADMVDLLLDAGADQSLRDASGATARDLVLRQGNAAMLARLDAALAGAEARALERGRQPARGAGRPASRCSGRTAPWGGAPTRSGPWWPRSARPTGWRRSTPAATRPSADRTWREQQVRAYASLFRASAEPAPRYRRGADPVRQDLPRAWTPLPAPRLPARALRLTA